jgi:hypothetical protein
VTRFDTIELTRGARPRPHRRASGASRPDRPLKVAVNTLGGFRNRATFVLTGLDIEAKAALGICGARSGDKGGHANLGVWAETPATYRWLDHFLTIERLKELLPEARPLEVERYALPKILALNFVIKGLLGDGVAASLRSDAQAKTLAEYFRAKVVPVPEELTRTTVR